MAKTSSGVYQLPNGMWGYRYAYMLNGKQKDLKRTKDENGNPFKAERAAAKARDAVIIQEFEEYCENGRIGKDYGESKQSIVRSQSAQFHKKHVGHISLAFSYMMCPIFLYQN